MYKYLCLLFIFIELGLFSIWSKDYIGWYWLPMFQFGAGLLVVLFAGLAFTNQRTVIDKDPKVKYPIRFWEAGLLIIVAMIGWYCCGEKIAFYIEKFPVNPKVSDIIPLLEVYVQRFLEGQRVYESISMGTYSVYPNYFPLFWMPFAISELGNFDYRWLAFGCYVIAVSVYTVSTLSYTSSFVERLIKTVIPVAALWLFLISRDTIFGLTVELLLVGFYLLLIFAMMRRSFWMSVLMLIVCLLSRYVIVLALPLLIAVYWKAEGSKRAIRMGIAVALGCLICFGPFLKHNWKIPITSYHTYQKMITTRWTEMDKWTNNEIPQHRAILAHGFGLGYYFYERLSGDGVQKMKTFGQIQKWSILFFVFLAAALYWWRQPEMDYRLYLLICLKIYFLLFYSLIQVPWPYLFLLPGLMSLPLIWEMRFSAVRSGS